MSRRSPNAEEKREDRHRRSSTTDTRSPPIYDLQRPSEYFVDDTAYNTSPFKMEDDDRESKDEEYDDDEGSDSGNSDDQMNQQQIVKKQEQQQTILGSSPQSTPSRNKPNNSSSNNNNRNRDSSPAEIQRQARISSHFAQFPLLVAPTRGPSTSLQQCVILRDSTGNGFLLPSYSLFFQGQEVPAMVALKQGGNKTSNYHIFDMTRGVKSLNLSKKSGNYMGKLRSNFKKTENILYTNSKDKVEVGSFSFNRPGIFDQLKEGSQPRKLHILLPTIDDDGMCVAIPSSSTSIRKGSGDYKCEILSLFESGSQTNFHQLETKEPIFENGNYRLNFHGRVTIPSVKNYQLTSVDDIKDVVCQFGRVGDDRFHLDFKRPFNAFQAFATALTQFNL